MFVTFFTWNRERFHLRLETFFILNLLSFPSLCIFTLFSKGLFINDDIIFGGYPDPQPPLPLVIGSSFGNSPPFENVNESIYGEKIFPLTKKQAANDCLFSSNALSMSRFDMMY